MILFVYYYSDYCLKYMINHGCLFVNSFFYGIFAIYVFAGTKLEIAGNMLIILSHTDEHLVGR